MAGSADSNGDTQCTGVHPGWISLGTGAGLFAGVFVSWCVRKRKIEETTAAGRMRVPLPQVPQSDVDTVESVHDKDQFHDRTYAVPVNYNPEYRAFNVTRSAPGVILDPEYEYGTPQNTNGTLYLTNNDLVFANSQPIYDEGGAFREDGFGFTYDSRTTQNRNAMNEA